MLQRLSLAALLVGGLALSSGSADAATPQPAATVQKLAALNGVVVASIPNSDILLVAGSEFSTGDLNGDGDLADAVMWKYTPGSAPGAPFVGSVLGDPHNQVVGGGVFLLAAERSGVDLNGDGDANDQGYFFARGSGPMTEVLAQALGLASAPPSMTVGNGAGIVVREVETEFGLDLDGDGSIVATDETMVVLKPGPVSQVVARTNPIFAYAAMTRLADGSIGGLVSVLLDSSVAVPPVGSLSLGHSGTSILTQVPYNQGASEQPTPFVFVPASGPPVTLPISGAYQVGNTLWGLSASGMCRISPAGTMSPCAAIAPWNSLPIDVGNGAMVARGYDRRTGPSTGGIDDFLITADGSITRLGQGNQLQDLGNGRAYVPITSGAHAEETHIALGGSAGPTLATGWYPGGAVSVGNRIFVDVYVGDFLTGSYVRHEYVNGALVPTAKAGMTFQTNYGWMRSWATSSSGSIVVGVDERAEKADINGDADATDLSAMLVDANGAMTSLGLAIGGPVDPSNRPPNVVALSDGKVAMIVRETEQGADLDGDGAITFTGSRWFLYTPVSTPLPPPPPPPPPPPAASSGFVVPARLLDTRPDGPQTGYSGAKPTAGQTVTLQVTGRGSVPTTGVAVVALNVTITEATGPGFVTVWGDGSRPATSNLNVESAGQTVPNLVLTPVAADGTVRIFTQSGGHLLADVMTFYAGGGGVTTGTPARVLETRQEGPQLSYAGSKPAAGQTIVIPVAGPGAAILNVTATDATGPGYVVVWPQGPLPLSSNLNVMYAGQTVPNLVIVPIGSDGRVRLYTQSGSHFVVDQLGSFT